MNTSFQKTVASDEWYTPKEVVDKLGHFDLDPCAPVKPLWHLADKEYNMLTNGLLQNWGGVRVWCNPPYSQPLLTHFCQKWVNNNNGILLLFARVDNRMFQDILLPASTAILFLRHRIRFYTPYGKQGGSPGCGSVMLSIGEGNAEALLNSGIDGFYVPLHEARRIGIEQDLFRE